MITKNSERVCYVIMLAVAFSFCGCSDEDIPKGELPHSGDPVQFGVVTSSVSTNSRTVYGEPNGNKIPINWVIDDQVRIWSNQLFYTTGIGLSKQKHYYADYKVKKTDADGHKYHAEIVPVSNDAYLKWGENVEKYVFGGVYPASRAITPVGAAYDKGILEMQYITNQTCSISLEKEGVTPYVYKASPDMENAYMVAQNTVTANGNHVLLSFDPIMTTLKVHITAGKYEMGTGIIQPVTVTGISVIMPGYLQGGTLKYQMNKNTQEGGVTTSNTLNNVGAGIKESVFVGLNNSGKYYVDMLEGDQLELMAFLPPMNMENAIIKVHTVGGFNFQKTLTTKDIIQGYVDIKLPHITPKQVKTNNWISQLPNQMKVFDMSIPGFDMKNGPNDKSEAAALLKTLLVKGVRAFDVTQFVTNGKNAELANEITQVLLDFLNENTQEFIFIVYTNTTGNSAELDGFLDKKFSGWIDCPTKETIINGVRGKLVAGEYWQKGIVTLRGDDFMKNENFGHGNGSEITLNNNNKWIYYYGDNNIINQYSNVACSTEQTGSCGVVTIPNLANVTGLDNTDLLVQALIDCNFKFRSDKPSK